MLLNRRTLIVSTSQKYGSFSSVYFSRQRNQGRAIQSRRPSPEKLLQKQSQKSCRIQVGYTYF